MLHESKSLITSHYHASSTIFLGRSAAQRLNLARPQEVQHYNAQLFELFQQFAYATVSGAQIEEKDVTLPTSHRRGRVDMALKTGLAMY